MNKATTDLQRPMPCEKKRSLFFVPKSFPQFTCIALFLRLQHAPYRLIHLSEKTMPD
ncbi:MAG TPA: hypothetical protein VJ577_07355 [Burkholderiaceae bacterium]|nr:hypothetical protein [Burkholderiaceae bacterium]